MVRYEVSKMVNGGKVAETTVYARNARNAAKQWLELHKGDSMTIAADLVTGIELSVENKMHITTQRECFILNRDGIIPFDREFIEKDPVPWYQRLWRRK